MRYLFFAAKSNIKIFLQILKNVLEIFILTKETRQDTPQYYSFYSLRLFGIIGSRGTVPLSLNLGTRWRLVVKMMHLPFYHRKVFPVPIELKSGCAWTIWKREKYFALVGIRNKGSSNLSLGLIPATLTPFHIK